MSRPTIKSISERTGYSIGTVSNALRGAKSVKRETREEVQKVAKDLGYRVNLDALKLKTNKSYRIAVLVGVSTGVDEEWEGAEFTRILAGISNAIADSRYELSVFNVASLEESMSVLRRIVGEGLSDGVIFTGTMTNDPRIAYLQSLDFPFVTYGTSDSEEPHSYVDFDSEAAAFDATNRLLELGHRRIALINPPKELIYAQDRLRGYRRAHDMHGVGVDADLIFSGKTTAGTARDAFPAMMALKQPPSACICANEALTLGMLSAAAENGVTVGRDFAVISTDDLLLTKYFVPPPTAYYVPIEQTSRLLGEYMLKRFEGARPEETQKMIRAQLIERQPDKPAPEMASKI